MSRTTECRKLSVPKVAQRLGVSPSKVLHWVRLGEIRACNLARDRNGRPRYAIDVNDLDAFERSRQVVPNCGLPSTRRLRRRAGRDVKKFF